MTQEKFKEIIAYMADCIRGSEFENHVYAVGGAMRDLVMGNEIKDIDVCVDVPQGGIGLAEYLDGKGLLTRTPVVSPTYGTAMFRFKRFGDEEIESVHTRGEQYHDKESRNPETAFAPIEEDCIRRDLTMNALYLRISNNEILDLTGKGIDDIKNRICRVTNDNPDIVFDDDSLRILRVIRFACKYGFEIEEKTLESMCRNADRLSIITQERITDEFNKMMMTDNPATALCLLRYVGVMKYVLPELEETYDMVQNAFHFGTVWEHTLAVVSHNASDNKPTLPVRIACVMHDIGKIKTRTVGEDGRVHFYDHETVGADMVREIMHRMRYANGITEEVCFHVKNHMITKAWGDDLGHMKMKKLRKLMFRCKTPERFERLMEVIDADNKSHKPEHCLNNQVTEIRKVADKELVEHISMFGYRLPINGEDVMECRGIEAGPDVKACLTYCQNLAFSNPEITKEECLKNIKNYKIPVNDDKSKVR